MSMKRTLTFGTLAALTVATAVGCGQPTLTNALPGVANSLRTPIVNVMGVERKLGYDLARYDQAQAPKAKPQHMPRQGLLPSAVDNRPFCTPVADQGKLGACTAFAMGKGLREYVMNKNKETVTPVSPLFMYYEERVLMDTVNEDSGATMTDGMDVLHNTGIAPESTWAYDISKFTVKPPAEAYSAAPKFKLKSTVQLAGLDDVKSALAAGKPVVFGFRVYKSFMTVKADGKMPVPAAGEQMLGGHAVMAVGYNDESKTLIMRNSWAEKWGDKGYFYMPYEIFAKGHVRDIWTTND